MISGSIPGLNLNGDQETESASSQETVTGCEPQVQQSFSDSNQPHEGCSGCKDFNLNEEDEDEENSDGPDQENDLAPGSRILPEDAYCFHKNLGSSEVNRNYPALILTPDQAAAITSYPQLMADSPSGPQTRDISVFDGENRRWRMMILSYRHRGMYINEIVRGWDRFTRFHDLKEGDTIRFYKNFDPRVVSDGTDYYIIRFTKI